PSRSDVKAETPFAQAFAENLQYGKVLDPINWDIPQNNIIDMIQNVIYKKNTVAEAATMLDSQLREYAASQSK
ncbi:MAG: hypothetical protein ACRCY4_06140, partial [Brevinema sp.]